MSADGRGVPPGSRPDAVVEDSHHRVGAARSGTSPAARLVVRPATFDDLAMVVDLRLSLLGESGDHPIYGRLRADARERAFAIFGAQLRAPHETILLAERGGERRVVGILRCVDTPASPLFEPDRYCYVSSVYVRPEARRLGVLRALLRAAEAWCVDRGLREMRLHNVPGGVAAAAWQACGFECVEEVRLRRVGK